MKKIIITLICLNLTASLLLAACQQTPQTSPPAAGTSQPANNTVKVLAVETFLAEIAQNVAGNRLKVDSLIPLGVDPHAFELTPQDVVKIGESKVLILNGAGFESWADETLANAGGERLVIEASAGLTSREAREGEDAVLSPEEKADQICLDLADLTSTKEIRTGNDAAGAAELHDSAAAGDAADTHEHEAELLTLKLNPAADGYMGFVLLDITEDAEYVISANSGRLSVTGADGVQLEAEESLPMNCAGLNSGILFDLEPGEYVIELSGLAVETTPFFAGSAGGHHHQHTGDPHFWLDPTRVVRYVENIRDGLIAADSAGKDVYTQNAAAYIIQLNELDAWIKQQVSAIPTERRRIVTNHESFGYYADRYGFSIIGTVIPSVSTDALPSAQQMARLVDRINKVGAIAIFLETGSSPRLAEQIAAETGIKVVSELYTHSITDPNGEAPTYIDMLKYNTLAIVAALK